MRAYWEARDPIALYEKFLTGEKLLDPTSKKEIDEKIDKLLSAERDFAAQPDTRAERIHDARDETAA